MPKPSQSHYMTLDDRTRSESMADASPLSIEEISKYASPNRYTRSWEISRENVKIKQIVGKGAFGQVAKATADDLQGRAEKTLVAVKLLKGTGNTEIMMYRLRSLSNSISTYLPIYLSIYKSIDL